MVYPAEKGCHWGLEVALHRIYRDYGGRDFSLSDLCEELDFMCGAKWTEKFKVGEVQQKWAEVRESRNENCI